MHNALPDHVNEKLIMITEKSLSHTAAWYGLILKSKAVHSTPASLYLIALSMKLILPINNIFYR